MPIGCGLNGRRGRRRRALDPILGDRVRLEARMRAQDLGQDDHLVLTRRHLLHRIHIDLGMGEAHVQHASRARLIVDQTARRAVGHVDGQIGQRHALDLLQFGLVAERRIGGEFHAELFGFQFGPTAQNVLLDFAGFALALLVVLFDVITVAHLVRPVGLDAERAHRTAEQTGDQFEGRCRGAPEPLKKNHFI